MKTILLKPLVTEKSTQLQEKNVYGFEVALDSNKDQIAEQVKKLYEVEVGSVRITVRKGKFKRVGKAMKTKKKADRKIAYVTVTKGSITVFPKP